MSNYITFAVRFTLGLILGTALSCAELGLKPQLTPPATAPSRVEMREERGDTLYNAYTYFAMASILMAHGQNQQARDYLYEAIKLDPN